MVTPTELYTTFFSSLFHSFSDFLQKLLFFFWFSRSFARLRHCFFLFSLIIHIPFARVVIGRCYCYLNLFTFLCLAFHVIPFPFLLRIDCVGWLFLFSLFVSLLILHFAFRLFISISPLNMINKKKITEKKGATWSSDWLSCHWFIVSLIASLVLLILSIVYSYVSSWSATSIYDFVWYFV